jgi:TonB C terminal
MFVPAALIHKTPPREPAGATVLQPIAAPAEELVLVNVHAPKERNDEPIATTVDLRSQLTKVAILLVTLDRVPAMDLSTVNADAETSAQADANPGDAELRARMFGRYTGQISARIERAWEKPKSPVSEPKTAPSEDAPFVCQVQIRQDNRGNVQEVLLLACNGTDAWRHSLVVAINQSSPLPAPPIPSVFKPAITMNFESRADREGNAGSQSLKLSRGESQ